MAIPPEFVDELRSRLSIASVIGGRVRLQKRGREHTGLCPFHKEKTPSFTVSEEKGFFHCFGCGAHGDVVGFVMRSDGLSFPEAVERLAREAGLQVPASSPEERQREPSSRPRCTARWRRRRPGSRRSCGPASAAPGCDYFKRPRACSDDTIARFRLGYAPDSRSALKDALAKAGIAEALLIEAGLVDRARGWPAEPMTASAAGSCSRSPTGAAG